MREHSGRCPLQLVCRSCPCKPRRVPRLGTHAAPAPSPHTQRHKGMAGLRELRTHTERWGRAEWGHRGGRGKDDLKASCAFCTQKTGLAALRVTSPLPHGSPVSRGRKGQRERVPGSYTRTARKLPLPQTSRRRHRPQEKVAFTEFPPPSSPPAPPLRALTMNVNGPCHRWCLPPGLLVLLTLLGQPRCSPRNLTQRSGRIS